MEQINEILDALEIAARGSAEIAKSMKKFANAKSGIISIIRQLDYKKAIALSQELNGSNGAIVTSQSVGPRFGTKPPERKAYKKKATEDVEVVVRPSVVVTDDNELKDKINELSVNEIAKKYKKELKGMLDNLGVKYPAKSDDLQKAAILKKFLNESI